MKSRWATSSSRRTAVFSGQCKRIDCCSGGAVRREDATIVLRRSRPLQIVGTAGTLIKCDHRRHRQCGTGQLSMAAPPRLPPRGQAGCRSPGWHFRSSAPKSRSTTGLDAAPVQLCRSRRPTLLASAGSRSSSATPASPQDAGINGMRVTVTRSASSGKGQRPAARRPRPSVSKIPHQRRTAGGVDDPGASGEQEVVCCATVNGGAGGPPVASIVIAPAREAVVRVGRKPGTAVPEVANGARWDAIAQRISAATGRSTLERVFRRSAIRLRTTGSAMGVCVS